MALPTRTLATAASGIKEATMALTGYPGVYHRLGGEHAEVSILMKRVSASSESGKVRDDLFPEIREKLLAHSRAEEKEFYGPLQEVRQLEGLIERSLDEHREIEECLARLTEQDRHTEEWTHTFEALVQAVQTHVAHEEKELIPRAAKILRSSQAKEMCERYDIEERRQQQQIE